MDVEMADSAVTTLSLKRSREDHNDPSRAAKPSIEQTVPTPPYTTSPPSDNSRSECRQASEAPSSSALSSIATSTIDSRTTPSNLAPPAKKRKLTFAEKQEKELVEQAIKARKDAEKQQRRAEKEEIARLKAEKLRAKNEAKEEKKRELDLANQRKAEAEDKKARSQLRLTSLFNKPKPSPVAAADSGTRGIATESSDTPQGQKITSPRIGDNPPSDYRRYFLPFCPPSHSALAPDLSRRPSTDVDSISCATFDQPFLGSLPSLLTGRSSRRGFQQPRVSEVIAAIQAGSRSFLQGTGEDSRVRVPADLLDEVIMHHVHFAEDVRPPYYGSYTKIHEEQIAKVRRNPFCKVRADTNYDWDSEAEWIEPEEGEEILSDNDEEAESVDSGDEMDGFLDDEDDRDRPKGKQPVADVAPVCTRVAWEDPSGRQNDFMNMRSEWLVKVSRGSLDPYSTSYWPDDDSSVPTDMKATWGPLGLPKPETHIIGAAKGMKGPIMAVKKPKSGKVTAPKLTGESLKDFREAVDGSNLTKIDLLKALKERFPKTPNETLKETLGSHCARVGMNPDKRWRFMAS